MSPSKPLSINIYSNEVDKFSVKTLMDVLLSLGPNFTISVNEPYDLSVGESEYGETETPDGEDLSDLRRELGKVLNKYSAENGSDTPDFVLAKYLLECLSAFNTAVRARDEWQGDDKVYIIKNHKEGDQA